MKYNYYFLGGKLRKRYIKEAGGSVNPTDVYGAASTAGGIGAEIWDKETTDERGYQSLGASTGANALKYGATGASIGTMIMPGLGTAIGAGVGALGGGAYGYFSQKGQNENILSREDDEKRRKEAYTKTLTEQKNKASLLRDKDELATLGTKGNAVVKYFAKYGGKLKKNGGETDTLYTSDKNDPRLKAYSDSLSLSNTSNRNIDKLTKEGYVQTGGYDTNYGTGYTPLVTSIPVGKGTIKKEYNKNIRPVKELQFTRSEGDGLDYSDSYSIPKYKSPIQPVEYKAKPTIKFVDETKPYISQEYKTITGDGEDKKIKVPQQTMYSDKYVKDESGNWTYYDKSRGTNVGVTPNKSIPANKIIDLSKKTASKQYVKAPDAYETFGMNKAGGKIIPLANGVEKAYGAKHENGGIAYKGSEIEGQEIVLDGSKVISDSIDISKHESLADRATKLAKQKGDIEDAMKKETSIYRRNTLGRNIQKLDKDLKDIYTLQEQYKNSVGLNDDGSRRFQVGGDMELMDEEYVPFAGRINDIPGTAGNQPISRKSQPIDWSNIAQTATPFVDNIYNSYLINNTPRVPIKRTLTPEVVGARDLQTDYNIDNMLYDNARITRDVNRNVASNSSSSQDVRKSYLKSGVNLMEANNRVMGDKFNIETQLKNADALNKQGIDALNTKNRQEVNKYNYANIDDTNYLNMVREGDIQTRKSQNVAQAVNDVQNIQRENNMKKSDIERYKIDSLRKLQSGVMNDVDFTKANKEALKDKDYAQKAYKALTNEQQKAAFKVRMKEQYGHDLN